MINHSYMNKKRTSETNFIVICYKKNEAEKWLHVDVKIKP